MIYISYNFEAFLINVTFRNAKMYLWIILLFSRFRFVASICHFFLSEKKLVIPWQKNGHTKNNNANFNFSRFRKMKILQKCFVLLICKGAITMIECCRLLVTKSWKPSWRATMHRRFCKQREKVQFWIILYQQKTKHIIFCVNFNTNVYWLFNDFEINKRCRQKWGQLSSSVRNNSTLR